MSWTDKIKELKRDVDNSFPSSNSYFSPESRFSSRHPSYSRHSYENGNGHRTLFRGRSKAIPIPRSNRAPRNRSGSVSRSLTRFKPSPQSPPVEFVFNELKDLSDEDDDYCDDQYKDLFEKDKQKYEEMIKKYTYIPKKNFVDKRRFNTSDRFLELPPRTVPITSYGIILFYRDPETKVPYFLLAQRRDTIAYVDFLRGNYHLSNVNSYFSLMTPDERKRLITYSFEELWKDLWVNHDTRLFRQEYRKAQKCFYNIVPQLNLIMSETESKTPEPQYGFPKGKKHIRETELEAAIREFEEETKMDFKEVEIRSQVPVVEVFQGFNSKLYKTVYFVAEAKEKIPIKMSPIDNVIRQSTVSEEIGQMNWFNLVDAKNKLNEIRQNILNKVYLMIINDEFSAITENEEIIGQDFTAGSINEDSISSDEDEEDILPLSEFEAV